MAALCAPLVKAFPMEFSRCVWLNEPETWSIRDGGLSVVTDGSTDFWRDTHYGFTRDSGHFLGCGTGGEFTAQLCIQACFEGLYDQAGIMVRLDDERWVKAGLEFSDGRAQLGSVLTVGRSDWATSAYDGNPANFWMRVTVKAGVLRIQASADGLVWPLLRLAPFPVAKEYRVGPMCCTPERKGLSVNFSDFTVSRPLDKDLHDLS